MTENLLTRELARLLRVSLNSFQMNAPTGELSASRVTIFEGFLPPKEPPDPGLVFPFCAIQALNGSINPERAECAVDLVFGVYSKESLGYQFAMNLLRHSANALLTMADLRLARRYVLSPYLTWNMEQEQPYPAWYATLHTSWNFVTPRVIPSDI